jgi:hypothetical protein
MTEAEKASIDNEVLDAFEVTSNPDSSITITAPWGVKSTVSSWHLVDERKLQMYMRVDRETALAHTKAIKSTDPLLPSS